MRVRMKFVFAAGSLYQYCLLMQDIHKSSPNILSPLLPRIGYSRFNSYWRSTTNIASIQILKYLFKSSEIIIIKKTTNQCNFSQPIYLYIHT